MRDGAHEVIVRGGCSSQPGEKRLRILDGQLLEMRVSPGGSADLLAATLFLDAVERKQTEVLEDQSWSEDTDGTHGI